MQSTPDRRFGGENASLTGQRVVALRCLVICPHELKKIRPLTIMTEANAMECMHAIAFLGFWTHYVLDSVNFSVRLEIGK